MPRVGQWQAIAFATRFFWRRSSSVVAKTADLEDPVVSTFAGGVRIIPEIATDVRSNSHDGKSCFGRSQYIVDASVATGSDTPSEEIVALVCSAAAAEDMARARRLCLRLLARQEAGEAVVPLTVWRALVGAHARTGDVDAAFALLRWFEGPETTSNNGTTVVPVATDSIPAEVLEALIAGLVEARRLRAAFETFHRMRTWILVEPSARLYAVMIRACGLARDPNTARQLFDELAAREVPTAEARAELVVALASRARTGRAALQIFNNAVRHGDPLRLDVCRAIGSACARGGLVDEAKRLQRRMLAAGLAPDSGLQADLIHAFGSAAARVGDKGADAERVRLLTYAWRVVQDAHKRGAVDSPILAALAGAYCACGLAEHAEGLLSMYPTFGCGPDAESYGLVLNALEQDAGRFKNLWYTMLSRTRVKPTGSMLQVALRVAISARDAPWAHAVLELMFTARVQPGAEAAEELLALPTASSRTRDMRHLLQAFKGLDLGPAMVNAE